MPICVYISQPDIAMLLRLTPAEMLKQWRLMTLLEPLAPADSGAAMERTDAVDADGICTAKMRAWYLRQLDTAPVGRLEVSDISSSVTLHCLAEEDAYSISLPREVRRVVGVRLTGWREPVAPAGPAEAAERADCSSNPYLRGGDCRPIVTLRDRTLHILSPLCDEAGIEEVSVVMEPSDGMYVFDELLLGSITSEDLKL